MRNHDLSKSEPTSVLWGGLIQTEADEEYYEPEKVFTDSMGEPIDDADGVFELTFIHNGYCEQTGVFESGETCLIVTQMNIVDAIEEYDAEFLKNIEYIGTGKYYKENEYGR